MKKQYIQPYSCRVSLFTEDALLSISGGKGIGVGEDKTTDVRWSQKADFAWSNQGDAWDDADE